MPTGRELCELWPMVGRDEQLEAIEAAYGATAGRPATGGAVLYGEAGVGKTRLAREAAALLTERGCPTGWATATRSAAVVPLGVLNQLLSPGDLWAPEQPAAFGSLIARLGDATERPVFVVDDAHLLDETSAALLFQLATERRAFVVLTARTGEVAPDAVTALWTTETAIRIDVPGLTDTDVDTLLDTATCGRVDPVSALEIRRLCGGNPLLLREMLHAAQETGGLRYRHGLWRWTGRHYVNARLTDVLRTRLGGLAPHLVALGELLACGEPLPLSILEALAGHDTVVEAERRGLVTVGLDGSRLLARLTHPIYADVFRADTPRSRERAIWRSLASALGDTPMRRRDDALLLAQWRRRADLTTPPDILLTAATHAYQRLDLDLAETLCRLAQQTDSGPGTALLLAEVLIDQGRYAEAVSALPPEMGVSDDLRSRWRVARGQIHYWTTTTPTTPSSEPAAAVDDDPATEASRSWLLLADGRIGTALRVAEAALRIGGFRPAAENWAATALIASAGLLGRHDRVSAGLTAALATAERHREVHLWGSIQVATAGSLAFLATGNLGDAADLADRCYRSAVGMVASVGASASPVVGVSAAIRGIIARVQGRARAAVVMLTEAAALLDGWPAYHLERACLAELAAAHAMLGDVEAARRCLEDADRKDATVPLLDAWVERARAWVTAAGGDLTRAAREATHAAARAGATEQPTIEALALLDAARFGDIGRARPRLEALARELRLPAVRAMADFVTGLRPGDRGSTLDDAIATLAGCGYLLYAAEAAMAAYSRYAAAGRRTKAHISLARATALAQDCGDARTHLLASSGVDALLTSRELQVAALAAAGHTGTRIAVQLGLSARTVNNHLGRAYQKLGVSGRAQLGEVLSPVLHPSPAESG